MQVGCWPPKIASSLGGCWWMAVEVPLQAASRPNAQPGWKIFQLLGALKGNQWALYLVGGLEHFWCFHILGIIIPTDFNSIIFSEGWRKTTNQLLSDMLCVRSSGDLGMDHPVIPWNGRHFWPICASSWVHIPVTSGVKWGIEKSPATILPTCSPGIPSLFLTRDRKLSSWTSNPPALWCSATAELKTTEELADFFCFAAGTGVQKCLWHVR